MKKWVIGLAAAVAVYFLLKGLIAVFLGEALFQVDSFNIYYGYPDQNKLEELSQHDAVILEPTAFTKEQISFLQKEDVLVFGYVSLVQLENWNKDLKKNVIPSDYWLQEGERLPVAEWDTYIMNISKEHYREVLMHKIETEVSEKNLDGIFFDTVDDIDFYFQDDATAQQAMRTGYAELLKDIEIAYPNMLIIQNRGFESYKTVSRKKVDGILWEGYDKEELKKSNWAQYWRNYLKKEQRARHVQVFTVVTDEESLQQSNRDHFPAFMRTEDTYH